MNTFTFTDEQVKIIERAILDTQREMLGGSSDKSKMSDYSNLSDILFILYRAKEKPEREPNHIIGECGGPEIHDTSETIVKNDAVYVGKPTTFSISTEAPETFDAAGFDALEFTEISEAIRSKEK